MTAFNDVDDLFSMLPKQLREAAYHFLTQSTKNRLFLIHPIQNAHTDLGAGAIVKIDAAHPYLLTILKEYHKDHPTVFIGDVESLQSSSFPPQA